MTVLAVLFLVLMLLWWCRRDAPLLLTYVQAQRQQQRQPTEWLAPTQLPCTCTSSGRRTGPCQRHDAPNERKKEEARG